MFSHYIQIRAKSKGVKIRVNQMIDNKNKKREDSYDSPFLKSNDNNRSFIKNNIKREDPFELFIKNIIDNNVDNKSS